MVVKVWQAIQNSVPDSKDGQQNKIEVCVLAITNYSNMMCIFASNWHHILDGNRSDKSLTRWTNCGTGQHLQVHWPAQTIKMETMQYLELGTK